MRSSTLLSTLATVAVASAQRPSDTPICDYYTTALLKNNTADNQYTLLTLLVNTVVIGNYTQPNTGVAVPGILAPGMYNGAPAQLLPYFDGTLESSNRGGDSGVSVNFLDGGGAAPLMKNMPAEDDSSNQYFLLTHLYQFFGSLLGCSKQGMPGFDAYSGDASMYEVHKFMALNSTHMGYFISQVALAAQSFGVAMDDITAVGKALNGLFNERCAPNTTVIPAQGPALQAICIADDCTQSPNATCGAYETVVVPKVNMTSPAANSSSPSGTATTTSPSTATASASSTSSPTGNAAAVAQAGLTAVGLGAVVALFL